MAETLTPREIADRKKRTCSRCARGQHELRTVQSCAHYLCEDVPLVAPPDADDKPNPIKRSPAAERATAAPPPADPPKEAPVPQPTAPDVELEWSEPPNTRGGGRKLEVRLEQTGVLAALRGQPGRWAKVMTYTAKSSGNGAATRLREKLPDFEWAARKLDDGSAVWGRFPAEDAS